jgi:glutamine synthetase type III
MQAVRAASDEAETIIDARDWPLPTYTDLMHRV